MNSYPHPLRHLLVAIASVGFAALSARADVAVVSEGRATAVISLSSREPATQHAAKEIARYVKTMTGAELKTVAGGAGGPRIELDDSAEGLAQEEFRIGTKDDAVLLSGGSPRAVLYAAYELLEHWGCGFWSPLNESVPKTGSLIVESAVVIWDYNAQFRGFLLPTPIIDMMGPDLREYAKKDIQGVLMQMAGFGASLMDFAELRTWLCARLMWNPDQDEWELMRQWCDGACGAGAPAVKEWLDLGRKARTRKRSYGPYDPDSLHVFTPKELLRGHVLMQNALKATEGNARAHAQIRRLSLSPLTAVICNYNRGVSSAAKTQRIDLPPREKLVDEFESICTEYKVKSFGEGMPSVAEFVKLMRGGGELLKKPK